MTTQADLVANARSRLDEPTANQWTDVEIRRWINEAAKDIARRTESLQATASINSIASTQQYTAPVDTLRVYRVEYIDASNKSTVLEYRDFNNMDSVWWSSQLTVTGTPQLYTMWGFPPTLKIVVYPTPQSSADAFKVYYYRTATELATDGTAGSSTVDVPTGREELVIDYVEYMALRKDRDPRWQEAKALYDEKVNNMFEQTRRWTDQAGTFDYDVSVPLHPFVWSENWG